MFNGREQEPQSQSQINHPEEDFSMEKTVELKDKDQKSRAFAHRIAENPKGFFKEYQSNGGPNAFVAGGGLVEMFGSDEGQKESQIWTFMKESAKKNQDILKIAGIEFNFPPLNPRP